MSFNIPNVFIAGKKAVADEVNENFETIKDEINSHKGKINILENSIDELDEALNGGLREDLTTLIKNSKSLFCVNKGNLDASGNGDLLVIDSAVPNQLAFKVSDVDGDFSPLYWTNVQGVTISKTSLSPINMSSYTDGTYIIYDKHDGEPYATNRALVRAKVMPEMVAGDVWLDTSGNPLSVKTYNGVSYSDFEDVPLGEAVVLEGVLTSVVTYPYNQNGFDVNTETSICKTTLSDSIFAVNLPNYVNCIQKALNEEHIAEDNGYILYHTTMNGSASAQLTINDFILYHRSTNSYSGNTFVYPVAKGTKYISTSNANLYWLPRVF